MIPRWIGSLAAGCRILFSDKGLRAFGATLFLVSLIGVVGCGDDNPVKPQPPAPFQYLAPTSPQNVLANLVSAYERRDSVQTALVYDDSYDGESTDPSAPPPITFSKADEIRHVGRLKRDPNIVAVLLDLGLASSWQRTSSASDPPGWAIIQISNSTVQIEDIGTSTTYHAQNNIMEFKFKLTTAAPGDTTWTIISWSEFAN